MKEDGHTVLLTTHYLDEAEQLCDRIAIIDRGRVDCGRRAARADGAVGLGAAPSVARHRPPLDATRLDGVAGIDGARRATAARLAVSVRATRRTTLARAPGRCSKRRGIDVVELHVQKASLEDVFLELTGERP